MTHRPIILGVLVIGAIGAIGLFSTRLKAPTENTAATAAADEMRLQQLVTMVEVSGVTPVIDGQQRGALPTVTFLAKGDGGDVPRIISDVTGWGERADGTFDFNVGRMRRVGQTEWYSLETSVEPSARIEYLIAYGGSDYRLDPHNPRKVQRVAGPASEFVMPGYSPPQEFADPPVAPAGQVTEAIVPSRALAGSRRVIVYTPPDYRDDGFYPLAVFHDGALIVNTGEAPRVIDWLISHNIIEPIVAVFVDPKLRSDDFRRGSPMRTFVTDELLLWVAGQYSVTKGAGARAIIGVSAGAQAALEAALESRDSFNRIGLMIPALDQSTIDAVPNRDRDNRRLRVSIVAAHYDALNLHSARAAQKTLDDRGHTVDFVEVPEGHGTTTWRTHLRTVLISLFGKQSRS